MPISCVLIDSKGTIFFYVFGAIKINLGNVLKEM